MGIIEERQVIEVHDMAFPTVPDKDGGTADFSSHFFLLNLGEKYAVVQRYRYDPYDSGEEVLYRMTLIDKSGEKEIVDQIIGSNFRPPVTKQDDGFSYIQIRGGFAHHVYRSSTSPCEIRVCQISEYWPSSLFVINGLSVSFDDGAQKGAVVVITDGKTRKIEKLPSRLFIRNMKLLGMTADASYFNLKQIYAPASEDIVLVIGKSVEESGLISPSGCPFQKKKADEATDINNGKLYCVAGVYTVRRL